MSIEAINAVIKMEINPSARKFVAVALANYADENGSCFPSVKALSKFTCQSERAVQGHLSALEEMGFLTRKRTRNSKGQMGQYRYKIDHTQNLPVAESTSGRNRQKPPAESAGHNHHLLSHTSKVEPPLERADARDPENDKCDEALKLYQSVCVPAGLMNCRKLTKARKSQLLARLRDGPDDWVLACRKASDSPFLRGENPKGWKAGIDFLIRESSFLKILEGSYDEDPNPSPQGGTAADRQRSSTDIRRQSLLRAAEAADGRSAEECSTESGGLGGFEHEHIPLARTGTG